MWKRRAKGVGERTIHGRYIPDLEDVSRSQVYVEISDLPELYNM